jgi:hypothetical protein
MATRPTTTAVGATDRSRRARCAGAVNCGSPFGLIALSRVVSAAGAAVEAVGVASASWNSVLRAPRDFLPRSQSGVPANIGVSVVLGAPSREDRP